jgi:GAF domain-containing protein
MPKLTAHSRETVSAKADDAELRPGIGDLPGLVLGRLGLPELLGQVAAFAVRAIPGADGAGVTLLRVDGVDNKVAALAASAPFIIAINEIQHVTLNEGPSVTAAQERRTVRTGSLGGEKLWPRFGPRVGRMGVHSALSIPLLLPDRVVGAITAYSYGKNSFDAHAAERGELFAKPAAVAVHNAQILAEALALNVQLQNALSSRPIIDQAIGLIRGRTGHSAGDAFTQLRAISQDEHRKLADVARHLVDEAVRRARARHKPTWAPSGVTPALGCNVNGVGNPARPG